MSGLSFEITGHMARIFTTILTAILLSGCASSEKKPTGESLTRHLLQAAKEGDYEKADHAIAEFVNRHNESTTEELFAAINAFYHEMEHLDKSEAITLSVFMQSEKFYSLPSAARFHELESKAYSQGALNDTLIHNNDMTTVEPDLIEPDLVEESNAVFDLPELAY